MKRILIASLVTGLLFGGGLFLAQAEEKGKTSADKAAETAGNINELRGKFDDTNGKMNDQEAKNMQERLDSISDAAERCHINKMTKDISELISSMEDLIKGVEDNLKSLETELGKISPEDIENLDGEIRRTEAKIKIVDGKLKATKRENNRKIKRAEDRIRAIGTEINKREERKRKDYAKAGELKPLYDKMEEYVNRRDQYEQDIKNLENERNQAKTDEEKNQLKKLIDNLHGQIRRLDNQIDQLDKQCKKDDAEKNKGIADYLGNLKKIKELDKERRVLNNDIAWWKKGIDDIQQELDGLNAEKKKLEDAKRDYKRLKNDIDSLKNRLEGLKKQIDTLEKLLAEKSKDKKDQDQARLNELRTTMRAILSAKGYKSQLPGAPPAGLEAPALWSISVMGVYGSAGMNEVNKYIGWINALYDGDIAEINSGVGVSIEVRYQLTPTFGVGLAYEHISASAKGTLVFPDLLPPTLSHSQTISANGFLGVATIKLPQVIEKLEIRGIAAVGVYRSKYEETENGYTVTGSGSTFGYKLGAGYSYSLTERFGICGETCYRGIAVDEFKDSAGDILQYVTSYGMGDIKADLSGFGVAVGVVINF